MCSFWMHQAMDAINQTAHQIVDIIGVIDGSAFQAHILAPNAAVEAPRITGAPARYQGTRRLTSPS